jgi:hypothetical protein
VKISLSVLIVKFVWEGMLITLKESVQLVIKVFFVETAVLITQRIKILIAEDVLLASEILFKHLLSWLHLLAI